MKKLYPIFLFAFFMLWSKDIFAQNIDLISKNLSAAEVPAGKIFQYPNAVKTKYVQMDFNKLNEEDIFELGLFNDEILTLKFAGMYQYTVGSAAWYGKSLSGEGHAIFSFYQNHISGIVQDANNKKYMIQQFNTSDIFAITEITNENMREAPEGINDFAVNHNPKKKTRVNPDVCAVGTSCPGADIIDIMVLGTAAAIVDGGGTVPAFTANVTAAVTEMNTAYTSSGGVDLTFNLIHCDVTAFATTADLFDDLDDFTNDVGVQTLRDAEYADLVSLWAGSGNYAGFCGVGWLNTAPADYDDEAAYNVCDYGCGMTNLSFAHECGHNMGLRHDYYVDPDLTPCTHHHGYTNSVVIPSGLPMSGRWRTIMAYNNECAANGFGCTRIARWANPASAYLGDPTGVAIGSPGAADEIYGFARFKCVVAGFRNSPLPVELLSFKGEAQSNNIELTWTTVNEINLKGYEVEMKQNFNSEFQSIGFVGSNSNKSANNYKFILQNKMPGKYYFRLKQMDQDGHYKYSEVIEVEIMGNSFQTTLFPNPARDMFTISMFNPKNQNLNIALYDLPGRKISNILNENTGAGGKEITVNTSGIPAGIYFCIIECGNEQFVSKMIIE